MTVNKLREILKDMPGEAVVTIGEDYDCEAKVVMLMRKYIGTDFNEVVTTVNIDN